MASKSDSTKRRKVTRPEQAGVKVTYRMRYPEEMRPAGVSFVSMSRINTDVQLDLGAVNLHQAVQRINEAPGENSSATVDANIVFSAYLTPAAFLKLHKDVNQFYALLKDAGMIEEENEK